jgi:hypothetical protein
MHSFALFQIVDATTTASTAQQMSYDTYVTRYSSYAYIVEQQKIASYSSADCIDHYLHNKSHLFGGGLSGHAQSTVAHGGGSRSEGGGRADEEGGNSELHVDNSLAWRVKK